MIKGVKRPLQIKKGRNLTSIDLVHISQYLFQNATGFVLPHTPVGITRQSLKDISQQQTVCNNYTTTYFVDVVRGSFTFLVNGCNHRFTPVHKNLFSCPDWSQFCQPNINTSPPLLKKDGDNPYGTAALCLLRKSIVAITSICNGRPVSTSMDGWKSECGRVPSKIFPQVLFGMFKPKLLGMNRCAVSFLIYRAYVWLLWTNIPSPSVKVVTISDSCSLLHSLTMPYVQLLPVASQTSGHLTSQECARLIVFCIWSDGSASI